MTTFSRLQSLQDQRSSSERDQTIAQLFPKEGDSYRLSMVTRTLPQHILPLAILEVMRAAQEIFQVEEKEYRNAVHDEEVIFHQVIGEIIKNESYEPLQRLVLVENAWDEYVDRLQKVGADFIDPLEMTEEDTQEYNEEMDKIEEIVSGSVSTVEMNLLKIFIEAFDRRQISRNGEGRQELLTLLGQKQSEEDKQDSIAKLRLGEDL